MDEPGAGGLDRTDYRILQELSVNGRMSDVTPGKHVHMSSTAVARRRKLLEEQGLLRGYTADVDMARLGFGIVVMVTIELVSQAVEVLQEFEQAAVNCPSTSYCSFISGDTDFLMIVHVRSLEDYDRVYRSELSTLPHVSRIRSSFVMRPVLDRPIPPALLSSGL